MATLCLALGPICYQTCAADPNRKTGVDRSASHIRAHPGSKYRPCDRGPHLITAFQGWDTQETHRLSMIVTFLRLFSTDRNLRFAHARPYLQECFLAWYLDTQCHAHASTESRAESHTWKILPVFPKNAHVAANEGKFRRQCRHPSQNRARLYSKRPNVAWSEMDDLVIPAFCVRSLSV